MSDYFSNDVQLELYKNNSSITKLIAAVASAAGVEIDPNVEKTAVIRSDLSGTKNLGNRIFSNAQLKSLRPNDYVYIRKL